MGDRRCNLCNTGDNDFNHTDSPLHRFNFLLFAWRDYKKPLLRNQKGITIVVNHCESANGQCKFFEAKGEHFVQVTPNQYYDHGSCIIFNCNVNNTSKNSILITSVRLIHTTELFTWYEDDNVIRNGGYIQLEPNSTYPIYVKFKNKEAVIGSIKNTLIINFQLLEDPEERFTIARTFCVHITEYGEETLNESSPFVDSDWDKVQKVTLVPPKKKMKYTEKYPIPPEYALCLKFGLKHHQSMSDHNILSLLQQMIYPGRVTATNYKMFFHIMLWLEEMSQKLMLRRYNMSNVTVELHYNYVELEVPGLAEKRPSLIQGDMIDLRIHEDHTCYRGIITRINDKTIEITDLNDQFINYLEKHPNIELDVRFVMGRLPLERMHEGVDRTVLGGLSKNLFPNFSNIAVIENKQLADIEFVNKSILTNREQRTAVSNILFNTARNIPYIVWGPPGTGKTVTLVEAVLQIKRHTNHRILVCAPANAACDMIATKLLAHCTRNELIRVHSESVEMSSINEYLLEYSNINAGQFIKTSPQELNTYRIVVTTLVLVGRYAASYKPDVVFVDEAAQAPEPEVDIAIGFLRQDRMQLILAGDPKQLGPMCCSKVCESHQYEMSLLERLMEFEGYRKSNPNYITMLRQNYRCHPLILCIPNTEFYNNQLAAISNNALSDPVGQHFVFEREYDTNITNGLTSGGKPIEFYSVISKEKREGRSPSYFNLAEIQMVIKYVSKLLGDTRYNVEQVDIGVITPYVRQVYKIRDRLRKNGFDNVEVGTTETFQGREKRIIIISTVRAQHSLLRVDRKYNLGFVRHEKRFNVAMTRAMTKLVVIGCPHVLVYDDRWRKYIELCEAHGAYFGAPFVRRTNEVINQISANLNTVTNFSQYQQNYHDL